MRRHDQGLRRLWAVSSVREMCVSGIDWAPELPKGWRIVRAKYLLKKLDRQFAAEDTPLICTNKGEVTVRDDNSAGLVSSDEMNYQGVKEGDLLIHGMDTWHGAIAISKHNGKCTTVVHVCNSKQDKRYLCYFYRALAFQSVYKLISNGIRQNTSDFRSFPKFGVIPTFVPPLSEQYRIADYLDGQCGAIDKAKKSIEDEVETLQRLRKATIFKAVTKGLDGGVPMRDSGVQWIGFIPESWDTPRFKTVYRRVKRTGYPDEELLSVYLNHGVIRFSDDDGVRVHKTSSDTSGYQLVLPGELVMNNQQAWRGSVGVSPLRGIVSPAYHVYRAIDSNVMNARYANYMFRSCMVSAYELCSHGVGTIQRNISPEEFGYELIPLPPIDDQRRIADYLDERCAAIDSIIDARTQQLERLEDYRKALIYAYATGKKEVPAS